MASFDENGKYIKTNWKAGDKITATKLNKIEESIEAVNDNDISRHVEADARLDALEAKDVAHDKEFTNVKNLIEDAKDAAELGDYEINSRMQFLEQELEQSVAEVNNVANTVDGKIAKAESDMEAQINSVNTNTTNTLNKFQNEVNTQMNEFQNEVNEQLDDYLPLSGGTMTGNILAESPDKMLGSGEQPWGGIFLRAGISIENDLGSCGINTEGFFRYNAALKLQGGASGRIVNVDSDNLGVLPDGEGWNLGSGANRWGNIYSRPLSIYMDSESHPHIDSTNLILNLYNANQRGVILREYADGQQTTYFMPTHNGEIFLGSSNARWRTIYSMNNVDVSSDRSLKENIEYVGKAKSGLTYVDMYNFVKDDLGLATYNFIGDDQQRMNFIAQDLLVNEDGTDNKIGQMIVNPVAVPTEEEIANGTPYPTLSYDSGMYISVLAGALKEAINKIEQLEARINELENK